MGQKYIDKRFLDRAPIGLDRHKRHLGVEVDGKIMPRAPEKPNPALRPIATILTQRYAEEEARDFDNVANCAPWTKKVSTWRFFTPAGSLRAGRRRPRSRLAAAIAKAYNDWLFDFCNVAPARMYGAAIVAA